MSVYWYSSIEVVAQELNDECYAEHVMQMEDLCCNQARSPAAYADLYVAEVPDQAPDQVQRRACMHMTASTLARIAQQLLAF